MSFNEHMHMFFSDICYCTLPRLQYSIKRTYFLRFYLFLRGRERERERNISVWFPLVHPLLGTWPATQAWAQNWELNRQPFDLQASTQSTKLHQPGLNRNLTCMGYHNFYGFASLTVVLWCWSGTEPAGSLRCICMCKGSLLIPGGTSSETLRTTQLVMISFLFLFFKSSN